MKRFARKFLTGILAASLMLSSSMVVFAAGGDSTNSGESGTSSGEGVFEGYVNKEVYRVVLPTVPAEDTVYDFILDPEGLIAITNAEKYGGSSKVNFESGKSLYFYNKEENSKKVYTDKSNIRYIANLGSVQADITVNAKVTGTSNITLESAAANIAEGNKATSIWLAMQKADGTGAVTLNSTASGADLEFNLAPAEETAYQVTVNNSGTEEDLSDDKYEWGLTTAATTEAGKVISAVASDDMSTYTEASPLFKYEGFQLTGKANTYGDWSAYGNEAPTSPTVTLTWTVKQHVNSSAPSVTGTEFQMVSGQALSIPVDLGVGDLKATGIKSVVWGTQDYYADGGATFADNTITIAYDYITFLCKKSEDQSLTITFNDSANDGAGTSVTVTLKIPASS